MISRISLNINKHFLKEMQHFFETYKSIENEVVTISGIEGREKAIEAVEKSIRLYKEKFGK